ncbi:MAG: response regulator [Actinobacteria bacterium]|nr:response regulator [Actinomycetota bacterium]
MMHEAWDRCAFPGTFRRYQGEALEAVEAIRAAGHTRAYVVMPPGSGKTVLGLEVARRMRDDPARLGTTRIVLLSSSADRAEAKRAGELGIAGYLTKPVRQSQFYDCLATVMGDSKGKEPMVTPNRLARARAVPGPRLLLVEDNPVNQKVAVRSLEKMGYQVDVAVNGAEALPAAFRGEYAAILMDCQMPVMDGYEATAAIRRSEQARGLHTPIIAMTASAMEGDRERCLAAGMDDYLSKPLRSEALAAVLARWLQLTAADPDPAPEAVRGGALDSEILAHLIGMDEQAGFSLLEEVAGLLARDTPPRLAQMQGAIEAGDALALRQAAHALRGSAATVGATTMAALSSQLEELGRTGQVEGAAALLAELTEEVPRVIEALRAACTPAGPLNGPLRE